MAGEKQPISLVSRKDIILDELKDYNVRLSALKEAKKIALDKYVDFKDVGRALSEL